MESMAVSDTTQATKPQATTLSKFSLFKNCLLQDESPTIYDIFRPVYYCSLLAGMAQFNVREAKYTNCIWILLWNGILTIFCAFFGFLTLTARVFRGRVCAMYTIADVAIGWISTINVNILILFGCFFKNTILKILEDIHNLDQEFTILNFTSNVAKTYRTTKLQVIAAAAVTTIVVIVVMVLEEKTYASTKSPKAFEIGVFVTYCLPLMCTSAMLFQFCTFLAIIKQRYSWLNQQIENIAASCNKRKQHKQGKTEILNGELPEEFFVESVVNAIKTVQKKHKQLVVMGQVLNTAYSVQILTTIVEILFTFIDVMFFWAHKELKNDWGRDIVYRPTYVYYAVGLLLLHAGQLVVLVLFCSTTLGEANKSGYLIHDISYPSQTVDLQILHFWEQLLHHKVKFTACNLFELDETLLCSIVAAVTTYLVIVIQFEMSM